MTEVLTTNPIRMVHEPHGFVRLVEHMGPELDIVNAARVSLAKESEEFGEDDAGLIRFLLKNKHGSPFEHGFIAAFHIRLPIFVMREWVRHRIGFSVNEESGRYVKMRPDFYYPDKVRTQRGKPGAYTFEESENRGLNDYYQGTLKYQSERDYELYEQFVDEHEIAKEQARLFLPLNLYTEIRWVCNARSLMNFLALRNDAPAMKEIRDYAIVLEDIFKEHMPTVHQAFEEADRIAP
jgi:thymidylate synthase (FAD)